LAATVEDPATSRNQKRTGQLLLPIEARPWIHKVREALVAAETAALEKYWDKISVREAKKVSSGCMRTAPGGRLSLNISIFCRLGLKLIGSMTCTVEYLKSLNTFQSIL
jgi:hypothetical protein